MINYIFCKGWKFDGERMNNDMFKVYTDAIDDSKNVVFKNNNEEIIVTRNNQLCFVINTSGDMHNWNVTHPKNNKRFTLEQALVLKTIKKGLTTK